MLLTVKTRASSVYLQLEFHEKQNDYLTQTVVFLGGIKLEKETPASENWINSFILREYNVH